jgi:hypothetical protein
VRGTLAVVLGLLALAAPAQASTIVFVCGKDLCRTDESAKNAVRLTHDGASGACSRPTISIDG